MSKRPAFWKALHSLTHPLSIAAILILLFNDHWLRHNYPSWLTGKLGDFTWLLFAPFIAAMVFAVLIPRKIDICTKIVGLASIGFIGLWFATAKTIPAVHWLTTETLYFIMGYRGTLRMDVTDLLTLPALLISWRIWKHAAETKVNLKPVAYVAFGLGILGTMATTPRDYASPIGIQTVCEIEEGDLLANSHFMENVGFMSPVELSEFSSTSHISSDGGISWTMYSDTPDSIRCSSLEENVAIALDNSRIQFRWVYGEYIEKSTNGGETWIQIHDLSELKVEVRQYSDAIRFNGSHRYINNTFGNLLPASGIVHSQTGNLVLTMGVEGALVITPEGNDYWVAIGNFQLVDLQNFDLIKRALANHIYLIPTLWFLTLVTTVIIIHSRLTVTKIWLTIGWIHWTILVISANSVAIPPQIYGGARSGNGFMWGLSALFSLIFIAIPMILWASVLLSKHYERAATPIFVSSLLASMAYMLPLLLWTQGLIPRYYVAATFSLFLTACVLWACYTHYKDKLPERYEAPKQKRKAKDA